MRADHRWAELSAKRLLREIREFGYAPFNEVYCGWFRGPLPSRTCVGVSGLAVGAAIKIDLIAGISAA